MLPCRGGDGSLATGPRGAWLPQTGCWPSTFKRCSYHLCPFQNWLNSSQDSPLPPPEGFEGCSMVPSIYPLETLHNSLSLKQMDEFLTAVCESGGDSHSRASKALSAMLDSQSQPAEHTYIPQRALTSLASLCCESDSRTAGLGPANP